MRLQENKLLQDFVDTIEEYSLIPLFPIDTIRSMLMPTPSTSQPIGRKATSTQDLSLPHGPKNSNRSFYLPVRKSAPTENPRGIPSSHSGDRTSQLREVSGRMLYSRIPETRQPVNADLFLSGFFSIAISALAMSNNSYPRLPISRYAETPTHARVDYSTVFHLIDISEFAISRILMHMFRDLSLRNPDKVCHLSTY
jgi:hypothetical protein